MCFGPEGVEIDLKKYGNVVLIRGENLDIIDDNEDEKIASNGIGKSSIPEIIVFCLFGQTIRYPKKVKFADVINNQTGGKLRLEVRWNKYRVVRTRKPDGLKLWKSDDGDWSQIDDPIWDKAHEITAGAGMPATQKKIEEILGLNYETFVNLLVFADQPHCYFLEADVPQKRDIIENLMSLHEYKEYWENAKGQKREIKIKIDQTSKSYDQLLTQHKSIQERIVSVNNEESKWQKQKKLELENLNGQLNLKEKELLTSDNGKQLERYYEAQNKIEEINKKIPDEETLLTKNKESVVKAKDVLEKTKTEKHEKILEIQQIEANISSLKTAIANNEKLLSIKNKTGQKCNLCYGTISEENYNDVVTNAQKLIDESTETAQNLSSELATKKHFVKDLQAKIDKYINGTTQLENKVKSLTQSLDAYRREINSLSKVEKPEIGAYEKVLEEKIAELKKQIAAKKTEIDGPSPYVGILQSTKEELDAKDRECQNKKKELSEIENVIPYIDFWIDGYSPKGIPRSAINDVLPALNSRIAHWMQFLIDNKISLKFDAELNETIERNPSDGDPFIYYVLSGGERRRLNLAVSQAFAYIMMLSSEVSPSVVFLDEVTTNIDPIGVVGVYNMILELSKEKQVFITTHDQELLSLLSGNQHLFLQKKDGFTKIL